MKRKKPLCLKGSWEVIKYRLYTNIQMLYNFVGLASPHTNNSMRSLISVIILLRVLHTTLTNFDLPFINFIAGYCKCVWFSKGSTIATIIHNIPGQSNSHSGAPQSNQDTYRWATNLNTRKQIMINYSHSQTITHL